MRDLLVFGHRDRPPRRSPLLRTMVGDVLRHTRLGQHRTLADVAASARISMQYLSELERGRKEASSEILAALCTALSLDLSELLAAVGHDLLSQRDHRAGLVRIGAFRDVRDGADLLDRTELPPGPPPAPAPAPADGSLASSERAAGQGARGDLGSPASGAADPVCRLAA